MESGLSFDRHEAQRMKCACYIKNITTGETKKIMEEWKMQCTFDIYCHQDTRCNVFIQGWNEHQK